MENEIYFENPSTKVIITDKYISINRGNHNLWIHKALRGETRIFYDQIIEVKFKEPSGLGKGYIQFCTARTSMLGSLRTADQPQNAIKFNRNRLGDAKALRDFVYSKITNDETNDGVTPVSFNDSLEQHKKRERKGCLNKVLTFFAVILALFIILIVAALNSDSPSSNDSENESKITTPSYVTENTEPDTTEAETQPDIPIEYKNALRGAQIYSDSMHMSKQAIYDQLISEYGGQFSEDAAQYAVDNVIADYKENALEQAKTYQNSMHMSREAIRDQLTSDYGGQFTQEEADYAIDHLDE